MKIRTVRTIVQWLFVYLPVRFTVPFIGLLAWFLFYLWPWLLDFELTHWQLWVPNWI